MTISSPIQTSMNAGEFSPLASGRTDYPKYKNGVTLMQNYLPMVQGGSTRRTGTYYVQNTKVNAAARLVPFVFSNGDCIMMEFGDFYVRFYRNRAPVNVAGAAAYAGGTTYAKGAFVTSASIQYISLQDANTGHTPASSPTWWIAQDTYEIPSPYAIADVQFLRFRQSKDVVYIAHPSYKPRKLSRSALTAWSFALVTFRDGPYLSLNAETTTLTPSGTTGSVTVTASSIVGINGGAGFAATDVGRLVRLKHTTTWGWGTITAYTNTTTVTVAVDANAPFGATTATSTWRLGEWSDTTGYPSYVFSFEDRIGWAASPVDPIMMNLSKTGDYENMAPTGTDSVVTADSALQLRLNSKEQDPIRWVFDTEQGLVAGTKGAEYVVRSSTTGEAMSAINFPSARKSTKYGSANVEPVEVGKALLMVQTAKRKIREVAYVYNVDGFQAPDLTVLAEHITKGNVAQMAYQQEPFSVVWARLESGALRGQTYDRDQSVIGWHRHIIGGFSNVGQTADPLVESIACMPSPDGSQDDLWLIVNRYINGGTVRFVEYLTSFNADYDNIADCFFVDAGKTINLGSPGTAVAVGAYLEGQVVDLLVDGSPQVSKTVTGGAITLDRAGTVVQVGLGFRSRIKTLRPDGGSATGTAQGKTKRAHRLVARLHQSVGLWVGRGFAEDGVPVDAQEFRPGDHLMGQPVPMFSGDKVLDFEDDYNTDGYICLEQRQPLPSTILALMPQSYTQDGL